MFKFMTANITCEVIIIYLIIDLLSGNIGGHLTETQRSRGH
jgi:hypothetical protein